MKKTQTCRCINTQTIAIMSTFWTRPDLAGAMDTLKGDAMISKHLVIPHWDATGTSTKISYSHTNGKKYDKYKAHSCYMSEGSQQRKYAEL